MACVVRFGDRTSYRYLCLKKTCSLVLMSSKKHVLLLREQQEHAFKAFTEVLYRLIRDFTEV